MAESNTSNIGFEKQIWDAACVLRGNIDASEYKSVVLGLIFLKYISDRFETKHQELVDEGDGFEEDKDEYTAENIFFVPENARWSVVAAAAHTPEIGTVIDDAMRSIEQENKRLKGYSAQELCSPGAGQAPPGGSCGSVHQYPDGGAWQQQGHSGSHL